MEYDKLIEKIKKALKVTRKLELYEKMDLENILKEAWRDGYDTGFDEVEEDAREKIRFYVFEALKRLTDRF